MSVKSTIQWATPYSLALLLASAMAALAAFALLRWASGRPIGPAQRPGLLALRLAILAILGLIIINPVRVDETPGTVERPKLFYLLDTSQSMAIGKDTTRWDQVVQTIHDAGQARDPRAGAQVSMFRFGSRLAAVDADLGRPAGAEPAPVSAPGAVLAAGPPQPTEPPPAPTDSDTLLGASLEGLTDRFGQAPPQAVVVFSDGRARDLDRADVIARAYGKMKVPLHVLPVGDENVGGDVAIVSMVAPNQVRKFSRVAAQVYVRSYGYKGKRSEVKIMAAGPDGKPAAVLAHTPIVLQDGLASYSLVFESGDQDRRIEARIDLQPGEVSASNNAFGADQAIDHTKIRVLYLEGAIDRYAMQPQGQSEPRGAYSPLQEALMEDPDVECTAVMPGGAGGDFSTMVRTNERYRGLPETPSELFAFDAIILSNVPRDALGDQHHTWVEEWIGRRGGGLCMVGGPHSFASGQWNDTSAGKMLPVELLPATRDWDEAPTTVNVVTEGTIHPIWHLSSDLAQNRAELKTLPNFLGSNHVGRVKPAAEVIAWTTSPGANGSLLPAVVVQAYGRGRTMAMTTAITRRWAGEFTQSWGGSDARYYKKFWRNVVYWLTENSSIGRRRLLAETDKRLYRPGEPIVLHARTFDENAAPTLDYRVAVTVEPRSAGDVTSDSSPLRRPAGGPQPAGALAPFLPWSEEFELARETSEKSYGATLPIAEAKSLPSGVTLTQGLRIELTAYENNTQVDSTSLEVQVIDDPSEQQNPLPNHDLLRRIAAQSGGTVLNGAKDLTAMIERLPRNAGPPEVKTTPAWSVWWLLSILIFLLTIEWVWRRRVGLA
ncbi:MAG: glutamine amidotransferase [Isosphaerales bacterium]